MSIRIDEGVLDKRVRRGPALYYIAVTPEEPKAFVGIVPGYADHAGRYRNVMRAFAERGIGSVALDLRGHGRADGPRGYCVRFDDYLDDVRELRVLVDVRAAGAPQLLLGHSAGGLVATLSAMSEPRPLAGLLLSAPFFGFALEVSKLKAALGEVASRVTPRFSLPTGIRGAQLTHDDGIAAAYDADPLVFKAATARWFTEVKKAQAEVLERPSRLELPLYMVFGTLDTLASYEAGKRFFDGVSSKEKAFDRREAFYHEVLNEPGYLSIVDAMASFALAIGGARAATEVAPADAGSDDQRQAPR